MYLIRVCPLLVNNSYFLISAVKILLLFFYFDHSFTSNRTSWTIYKEGDPNLGLQYMCIWCLPVITDLLQCSVYPLHIITCIGNCLCWVGGGASVICICDRMYTAELISLNEEVFAVFLVSVFAGSVFVQRAVRGICPLSLQFGPRPPPPTRLLMKWAVSCFTKQKWNF